MRARGTASPSAQTPELCVRAAPVRCMRAQMCVREHARMRAARACQCARPHARDTYAAGADEPRARTTSAVDTNRMLPGHGGRAHAEHATPGAQRSAAAATRTHVPRQPVATRSAASRTRIVCTSAAFLLRYGHDGHANPFVVHQQEKKDNFCLFDRRHGLRRAARQRRVGIPASGCAGCRPGCGWASCPGLHKPRACGAGAGAGAAFSV